MKIPRKYLTKNPDIMKREIKKHKDKSDDDSSAYGPWDADYESGKAGKGKKVKTKPSKSAKNEGLNNLMGFDSFINEEIDKDIDILELSEGSESGSVDNPNSPSNKSLKKKSEDSGFPFGILKQIFKRGKAAWKIGHRPGTTPDQWAHARVNSFIRGGRTTEVSDGALYKKAKESKAKKKSK